MNYIKQLQEENINLKKTMVAALKSLNDFKIFLHSDKFTGVETNGERKDWIATGDVIHWINSSREEINQFENKAPKCKCKGTFHDDNCPMRIN